MPGQFVVHGHICSYCCTTVNPCCSLSPSEASLVRREADRLVSLFLFYSLSLSVNVKRHCWGTLSLIKRKDSMHKLRLRTRSTATTSKDSNADSSNARTRSPETIGRSSTSTSISNGNSRTSSDKGKGKEKGGGFKASIRQLGSDSSSSRKGKAAAIPQDSHAAAAQSTTATATLRPQLTLPKGDDFRTSLILVSIVHSFNISSCISLILTLSLDPPSMPTAPIVRAPYSLN